MLLACTYWGKCEAIGSDFLPIFISTENGKKHFCLDGSIIEKHQGRTITLENAEALAKLLVEYDISNLSLQNLNFDPGALAVILGVFNSGYLTFKNCRLDEGGFLALVDCYIQKKQKKIGFRSAVVELEINNSLHQIDLALIGRNPKINESIRQIAIWLLRNNSETINRMVIWLNEKGIFGNSYNTLDMPPLPLTAEEVQAKIGEQPGISSCSSISSSSGADEISTVSSAMPPSFSRMTVAENILIKFFRSIGIVQKKKREYSPGRLKEIPKNDPTPDDDGDDMGNIFIGSQ